MQSCCTFGDAGTKYFLSLVKLTCEALFPTLWTPIRSMCPCYGFAGVALTTHVCGLLSIHHAMPPADLQLLPRQAWAKASTAMQQPNTISLLAEGLGAAILLAAHFLVQGHTQSFVGSFCVQPSYTLVCYVLASRALQYYKPCNVVDCAQVKYVGLQLTLQRPLCELFFP